MPFIVMYKPVDGPWQRRTRREYQSLKSAMALANTCAGRVLSREAGGDRQVYQAPQPEDEAQVRAGSYHDRQSKAERLQSLWA